MKLHPCRHRPPCPGCPRYGVAGIGERAASCLAAIASEHGAALDEAAVGRAEGHRVRARLAVRGRTGSPKLGIFQEGSHRIADIPACVVHHPRINEAARVVKEAIRACGVAPYADAPHRGLLRYLQFVVERASGAVQVTLVANDESPASLEPLVALLAGALGRALHSVWWNGNTERTNVIFGRPWRLISGPEAVRETIAGAAVFFPAGAFGQGNLDLAERLVGDLHGRVGEGRIVAELYCGAGAIGLGLLARSRELRFNEQSPQGLRGLALGLEAAGEPAASRARVFEGDAAAALDALDGAETVIVDPPRRGLDADVARAIAASGCDQLLYVSCDPDSLARDARLLAAGGLAPVRLTPYDLFPFTEHVETLAEFARTRPLQTLSPAT